MNDENKNLEEEERPTKDLKVDESQLSEEDRIELHKRTLPVGLIIFMAVVIVLMVACIIVITNIK